MKFDYRKLKENTEPYIIAELGSNHNGDMELARKLIKSAKEQGADCVKFQSWSKETIFSKQVYDENKFLADDYRDRDDYTLEEIVDKFSISESQLRDMKEYCHEINIDFTSTPFSNREVDFLVDELNVDWIKVASMDLNNLPFLKYIAKKNIPVVLSTGMSSIAEIDEAVRTLEKYGSGDIVLLHCVSIYPPDDSLINLDNIKMLSELYGYPTGYSDHSLGIVAPIIAIGKGACMIEKHFTLDQNLFGWDHKISATPKELREIVVACKRGANMSGSYRRVVVEPDERIEAFRRSIVFTRDMSEGETISRADLDFKRPGSGIEPKEIDKIVGKKIKNNVKKDSLIKWEDF